LDDVEEEFDAPVVSISIGNTAIFLLGGKTRSDPPVAMYLRSGDIVIMGGESRLCYHGVPRILHGTLPKEYSEIFDTTYAPVLEYLNSSRININIRQVYPSQISQDYPNKKQKISDQEEINANA